MEFGTIFFVFFNLFLSLSQLGFNIYKAGMMFFNFFAIFLGIFYPGQVGMEFGTKIYSPLLSLSKLGLDRENAGMKFLNFSYFFAIFLGILLHGSGRNGIWDKIVFSLSRTISARFG